MGGEAMIVRADGVILDRGRLDVSTNKSEKKRKLSDGRVRRRGKKGRGAVET